MGFKSPIENLPSSVSVLFRSVLVSILLLFATFANPSRPQRWMLLSLQIRHHRVPTSRACITIQSMTSRFGRWLRDPVVLLCMTAGLLAFVVQSGELGTADTMHRLQTTHWMWTSQPQVFPNEYPEFGLHGRGGRLYSWYGIGQSLLMLPADLVGTGLAHLSIFSGYGDDPAVRSIVVSYSTSILVNVLTALIAFRLLRQLRFSVKEAVAGVLALLFCTTHLHYTQNMMENNYIMLLTLAGFSFQYEWLRTGSRRALFIGSAALGLNLLTRLTTGLDLIAGGVFLLAGFLVRGCSWAETVAALSRLLKDCCSRVCILPADRSPLSVLSLRLVYQYIRVALRQRAATAGPNPAVEFSLEHSISRGISRGAVQAGEVDLSF